MPKIVDVFRAHAPAYLAVHGERLPLEHRKVLAAILNCRTPEAGVAIYGCESCPDKRLVYLGCGNRHCPNCQKDKSRQWLDRAVANMLPGNHFFVTFTVPEEIRRFFRSHQRVAYDSLFAASSEALKGALANKKHCGADLPGFFGVLQTWTRQLEYHPHIHYVVPGGGIDRNSGLWQPTNPGFLVPARTLSKLVKAKFKQQMVNAGLLAKIPRNAWRHDWVVDVQAVGSNTEGVLKYLAPYVFRVAISDSRIVADINGLITFSYQPSGTNDTKTLTLPADEFIRRFLQHVLPTGFMKIRYYGFMTPAARIPRQELAAMIHLADADSPVIMSTLPAPPPPHEPKPMLCPCCGKRQRLLQVWQNNKLVYWPKAGLPSEEKRKIE